MSTVPRANLRSLRMRNNNLLYEGSQDADNKCMRIIHRCTHSIYIGKYNDAENTVIGICVYTGILVLYSIQYISRKTVVVHGVYGRVLQWYTQCVFRV